MPAAAADHGEVPTTVLVVDDHPSFRATARLLLESEGYAVVGEAADGAGAVEAVLRLRPGLVLLDVNLPDADGFDVAARLAALDGAPEVILVSSRDSADFGPLVAGSGARGFIAKSELSGAAIAEVLG
ncbi:MAG TPA: response regulator [Solirubrobacteraceae bacterium]|nr:response regulator [Solirubrobacteraceae bacterium]